MEKSIKIYHMNDVEVEGGEKVSGDVVMKSDYDELLKEHARVVDLARTACPPEGTLDGAKWLIDKFTRQSAALEAAKADGDMIRTFRAREADNLRCVLNIVGSLVDRSYDGKKIW